MEQLSPFLSSLSLAPVYPLERGDKTNSLSQSLSPPRRKERKNKKGKFEVCEAVRSLMEKNLSLSLSCSLTEKKNFLTNEYYSNRDGTDPRRPHGPGGRGRRGDLGSLGRDGSHGSSSSGGRGGISSRRRGGRFLLRGKGLVLGRGGLCDWGVGRRRRYCRVCLFRGEAVDLLVLFLKSIYNVGTKR